MCVHDVDMEFHPAIRAAYSTHATTTANIFCPVGNRRIVAENDGEQVNLDGKSLSTHTSHSKPQGSGHLSTQTPPSVHAENATDALSRNISGWIVAKNLLGQLCLVCPSTIGTPHSAFLTVFTGHLWHFHLTQFRLTTVYPM